MSAETRSVRIGIDVGGTFTHAVALEGPTAQLLHALRVPTTHGAEGGVARGIAMALERLLREAHLEPAHVSRVAHSTTQATNALLEGDLCTVGILAAGRGWEGSRVRSQTQLDKVELGPGSVLETVHRYVELTGDEAADGATLQAACRELAAAGALALVAAAAFSVDNPAVEERILEVARAAGVPATATFEVSELYGLKVRTRTAAVNAAILPKMLETAVRTEEAVAALGITAPVVVMRSDGGAMSVAEMKRRPILTILSGPAAGVAAALMSAGIADGIFLEVGGTSTDVSCIQNGRPHVQNARVGAHRLYLSTLDVRTVGVAGGSMVRTAGGRVTGVGPRSAHIAGLRYAAFPGDVPVAAGAAATTLSPKPKDPAEYLAIVGPAGTRWALTPTCAALVAGTLAPGDPARGDQESCRQALMAGGRFLGLPPHDLARLVLERGAEVLQKTVDELVDDYRVDRARLRLLGGGGGAGVWLPVLGTRMQLPASLVEHAPVISAIGAALSLLQETVERTLLEPTPEDLTRLRQAAREAVLRSGAAPATVEVRVEVDRVRGILRATATGAHELANPAASLDDAALAARAAELLGVPAGQATLAAATERFAVFTAAVERRSLFGLLRTASTPWTVLDRRGLARLCAAHGEVVQTTPELLVRDLEAAQDRLAHFGDAGKVLPDTVVVSGQRLLDLSGLVSMEQRLAACREEFADCPAGGAVALVIKIR